MDSKTEEETKNTGKLYHFTWQTVHNFLRGIAHVRKNNGPFFFRKNFSKILEK